MYEQVAKQQAAAGAARGGGPSDESRADRPKDDDVIDAEYEVKK